MVGNSEGEKEFERYLVQRELPFEYEPDIGGRNPDFVFRHPTEGAIAADVFEPKIRLPSGTAAFSSYPALRRAFSGRKQDQAKAVAAAGLPFVVVLSRADSDVSIDPMLAVGAMFGEIAVKISRPASRSGTDDASEVRTVLGSGGRLQASRNTSVSALAIVTAFNPTQWRLEEAWRSSTSRWADGKRRPTVDEVQAAIAERENIARRLTDLGEYLPDEIASRVTVLHNPHAKHKISLDVFSGPHDEQWNLFQQGDDDDVLYCAVVDGRLSYERNRLRAQE